MIDPIKIKFIHIFQWIVFASPIFFNFPCFSNDLDFIDVHLQQTQNKSGTNATAEYIDDIQGVSILNFTGNYDKLMDGDFNAEARKAVLQAFYENSSDDYDFVYIFTEFEYDTGGTNAFAVPLMNDVEGIGRPIYNNSQQYFSEKLQTIIDMSNIDSWSFSVANPSYDELMDTMVHELMHRWGVSVQYIDDQSQVSQRLLGLDDVHWSYFFNSHASVMYGSLWQENQSGQFQSTDRMHGLSPLDLYLSGFIGKESVADMFLINNATSGNNTDLPPPVGTEIEGESEIVSIDDIIAHEGERNPNHINSQHDFKVKFILLKSQDDEINSQSIARLYILQNEFQKRFFAETNGLGRILLEANQQDTGAIDPEVLEYNPILNDSINLQAAIDFLLNSAQSGWWSDRNASKVRDTITVIQALQLIVDEYPSVQNTLSESIFWLNNYQPQDNDEMAWMLLSGVLNSQNKQALLDELYNNEKPSGGWSFDNQVYASPYGTALVIKALNTSQSNELDLTAPTIQLVLNNLNQDNGFPYVVSGKSSLTASLTILKSINEISPNPQIQTDLINFILSKKLPDNSYGNETGTAHETALFVSVLESLETTEYQTQIDLAKSALNQMQSIDGSFQGSIYSTALAIQVFNNNNKPNLLFEEVSLSSNNVVSGEQVLVNYSINNSGASDAENISISAYYDNISIDNLINQALINTLSSGQIIEESLSIDTSSFDGESSIIMVIDINNEINEGNENDNGFILPITATAVSNTYELAFNQQDFVINPMQFDALPFQINASTSLTNLSLLGVNDVNVSMFRQSQNGEKILLQSKLVNLQSLETLQVDFEHVITQAITDVNLIFEIDPDNLITEFNDNNNFINTTINKVQSVDLSISQQDITLANQAIVGENQVIRFNFHNNGTEQSSQFNVNVYAEKDSNSQSIYQTSINDMPAGEQLSREFIWQPAEEGIYNLTFILDEENNLAETNETNNEVIVPIQIVLNSLTNLSISSEDLTFSPDPGLEGQDLHLSLQVHNNSAVESGEFDLKLYQKMNNGTPNVLISNIPNNNSINANSTETIEWDIFNTTLKGQQTLIVKIDSLNNISEFNENDNLVIKDIDFLSKADAVVSASGIQQTPTIPNIGQPLSVKVTVSNIGEQILSHLSVSLYTDSSQNSNPLLVENQTIVELNGGESTINTFDFMYPNDVNVDTLTVIVDELNTINEGDESNNRSSINVGNQNEILYVTEKYFSPNNDQVKDTTLIVFNAEETSNYTIQIIDENSEIIKKIDSQLFLNTISGDVNWDGLNNKGIVSRDGEYTVQLINQEDLLVSSTIVILDTNNTSIFESLKDNNGYTVDLNCIADFSNSPMQFSNDGKSLYLTQYTDLYGNYNQGLYKLKADGSELNSALPSELSSFLNIRHILLKNGNILFSAYKNGTNYLYLKNSLTGNLTLLFSELENNYPSMVVVKNDFVIVNAENDLYKKIYFNTNIATEQIDISSYGYFRHETSTGLILVKRDSYDHNSLYFLSYDFTQLPILFASDLTEGEVNTIGNNDHLSNDISLFAFVKDQEIHVYKALAGNVLHQYSLPYKKYYGLNTHNDMVVLNNDSTISVHNTSGQQTLKSSAIYSLEGFNPYIQNIDLIMYQINSDMFLEVNFSDRIFESMVHSVIGMTDSSDEKKIILLVENTMFAEFISPPCDESMYFCEGWTEFVSLEIRSVTTRVVIDYNKLTDIKISYNNLESFVDSFPKTQEGRSSLIKTDERNTYWISKNSNNNGLHKEDKLYNSLISDTFPSIALTNNDFQKEKRVEIIKSFVFDNPYETIENSCSNDPDSKYVYYSRSNLYSNLTLEHSQNGVQISATAFDEYFDRYEVYWSSSDAPESWNFIFSSNISPSDSSTITTWIPIDTGLFNIKLVAIDKAGNVANDVEQIFINNNASDIRNINVSPQYFSPNGDGIKDVVNIQYDVIGASNILIEILDRTGLIVRTYEREYLNPETAVQIQWDGRNNNGILLDDEKYQVSVNGFRTDVYLDTQPIILTQHYMLYDYFSNVNKINYPNSDIMEELNEYDDLLTYEYQSYNQSMGQWLNESSSIKLNPDNITDIINREFRIKTEDKAGNIGFTPIILNPIKFSNSGIYKITLDNDLLSTPIPHYIFGPSAYSSPNNNSNLKNSINIDNSPEITDWSNGDKIAYLIQVYSYESIESITLKTTYYDETSSPIVNTKLVNTLSPNLAENYITSSYAGGNINGNNLFNIKSSGTHLPMLMIELDKEDFPDISATIEVEFQIKLVGQSQPEKVKSTIDFLKENGDGVNLFLRKITFDVNQDLDEPSVNERNAYEEIIALIPENTNLQYFWVYQGTNDLVTNDKLFVSGSLGNTPLPLAVYSPEFVFSNNEYISRLFVLSKDQCKAHKVYQWKGVLDSESSIESNVLTFENDFCLIPKLEASFFIGEFCSNKVSNNSMVKFNFSSGGIDPSSNLPYLIELYGPIVNGSQQLLFSDTSPKFSEDEMGNLVYQNTHELDASQYSNGSHKFTLIMHDTSGNKALDTISISIDSFAPINQINTPQEETHFCAESEDSGDIIFDINANVSVSSKYGYQIHTGSSNNDDLIYQGYNDYSLLKQDNGILEKQVILNFPYFSGQSALILETFNASGASYCSMVNINVDALVDVELINPLPERINKNFLSTDAEGSANEIRLVTLEAHEVLSVELEIYLYEDQSTILGTVLPVSLVENEISDISWNGYLNGTPVIDGNYLIIMKITDACGIMKIIRIPLTVDSVAPVLEFVNPVDGQSLNTIQPVLITLEEEHQPQNADKTKVEFLLNNVWNELDVQIITFNNEIDKYEIFLDWNLSGFSPGLYPIRVTAEDLAGNTSTTQIIPELIEAQDLLWTYTVSPKFISPNADNTQDVAYIGLGLNFNSIVKIEIFDDNQNRVKLLVDNQPFIAGAHEIIFNGTDDLNAILEDGEYTLQMTLSETSDLSNQLNIDAIITVDNLAPQIQWLAPLGVITQGEGTASVNLLELHPQTLTIQNQKLIPIQSPESIINSPVSGVFELFDLSELDETQYQLTASAQDVAGNITHSTLSYLIDKTEPVIELIEPANDQYIGGIESILNIVGNINELNFDHFELSFSENTVTPDWQVIYSSTELLNAQFDYPWLIAANDGEALMRLSVFDKAGWNSEKIHNITIDSTAPIAQITQPITNAIVGIRSELIGSANDDNFDFYTLSYKITGSDEWNLFHINQSNVTSDSLGFLPENLAFGNYEVKLSAQDKVGLNSESIINLSIDNEPPPTPLNLTLELNNQQVVLIWDRVEISDLAGYIIFRNGTQLNPQIHLNNSYLDDNLAEGDYVYYVVAIDNIGNMSDASNQVTISIDTTPPEVVILSPILNQRVKNSLSITGRALSLLDFKEYKLFYREINQPFPGNLFNQSNIPVSSGLLGTLDTTLLLQDQNYIISLQATDNSGNTAMTDTTVYVDNIAPAAPVELYLYYDDYDQTIYIDWDPNSESDLAGYLIYNNGTVISGNNDGVPSIANSITNASYYESGLADGTYNYSVSAIDLTGNVSPLSHFEQAIVNSREPDTIIISPVSGEKFDSPIIMKATSPDTDIAEIIFEYSEDNTIWNELSIDQSPPYHAIINPIVLNLTYGNLYLRATAKDTGGQVDSTPAEITIEYTDLTPPAKIINLNTNIEGSAISLNWDANTETDLLGYKVFRTVNETTTLLTDTPINIPNFNESNLAEGTYVYKITAIDDVGNESSSRATDDLLVFSIEIEQPYSPLLSTDNELFLLGHSQVSDGLIQTTITNTNGTNPISDTTISINGTFQSEAITLLEGLNTIDSKQSVSANHQSIPKQVQVELSPIPQIPTNFQVTAKGLTNTLSWDSSGDAFGYLPYRNGVPIYSITDLESGLSYTASSNASNAQYVSDPDNNYSWYPYYSDVVDENETFIEISFDQSRWITSTKILWRDVPSKYRLQYYSSVGWIDIAKFNSNNQLQETVTTNLPYLTNKMRILITIAQGNYENIELQGLQLEHQFIETQNTLDLVEPDGIYHYQLSLINSYGFESQLSEEIIINTGDTNSPEAVLLSAQVQADNNVILNWDASVSDDVDSYWLYRNNLLIFTSADESVLSYEDMGLTDGQYDYYVRVKDEAGNTSENSNTVTINIQQQPLPAPEGVTIYPAISGQSLILDWQASASNRWHHYNVYRSLESGQSYSKIHETMENQFRDNNLVNGTTYYYVITNADEFDNESEFSIEVYATPSDNVPASAPVIQSPTVNGIPIDLSANGNGPPLVPGTVTTDISGISDPNVFIDLYNNNIYQKTVLSSLDYDKKSRGFTNVEAVRFSKNNNWYALLTDTSRLYVESLNPSEYNSRTKDIVDYTWNFDGDLLYIIEPNNSDGDQLSIYNKYINLVSTVFSSQEIVSAIPSPDESMVIYQGEYFDQQSSESLDGLWLYDIASATATQINVSSSISTSNQTIVWSNNNENIAFINHSNEGELYIYHVVNQQLTLVETGFSGLNRFDWSPNNSSLLYDKIQNDEKLFIYDSLTLQSNQLQITSNTNSAASFSPNGNKIAYKNGCCEVMVYDLNTYVVETIHASENEVESIKWNIKGIMVNVVSEDDRNIIFEILNHGNFTFTNVQLNPGTNQIHALARDESGIPSEHSLPIIINVESNDLPDLQIESDDLVVSPKSAIQGSHFISSAEITNNSQQMVLNAELLIVLTKPDGTSNSIAIPQSNISLQAQESQSEFIDLGTQQMLGEYVLQIILDPENSIIESNENNNSAYQTFNVIENTDPSLQMYVAPQIAAPNQDFSITMQVFNPSVTFEGLIELKLEDLNGFQVSSQQVFSISNLQNNSTYSVSYQWATAGLFAGDYQMKSLLKNSNGNVIAQKVSQIEIVSFAEFDLTMELNQAIINEGENIVFETGINYAQGNIPQNGIISWEILDDTQQVIWTKESQLPQMLPLFNTSINNQWLSQNVGVYLIKAVLNTDDNQQTISLPFEVIAVTNPTEINGTIANTPTNIILGEDFNLNSQMVNTSGLDLTNIPITLKVLNTDLSLELMTNTINTSMTANQVLDLSWTFSSEMLTSKIYLIALYADLSAMGGNSQQLLDTRSIKAIDTTGPEIVIIAPLYNSINPANVALKFTVIDQDSDVNSIQLNGVDINQGQPLDMNVSGFSNIYQYELFNLTSGLHQFTVSASDDFGNQSQETMDYYVDPEPPVITITGIENGAFYNQSVTAQIDINDENLLSSEIMLNNQVISGFIEITEEGTYFLSVRAEDVASNRSVENLFFVVDLTPPEIEIIYPANNAEIGELVTTVSGNTEPFSTVVLNTSAYQATTESNSNGAYNFIGVPLQLGSNNITIQATDRANNTGQVAQINVMSVQQIDIQGSFQVAAENPIENDLVVNYQLQNLTNIDSLNLPIKIELFNQSTALLVDSQTVNIDLLGSQTNNESVIFTTNGLLPGTYQLVLSLFTNNQWQQKSTLVFQFLDTTAPDISVLSPIFNEVYNAQLNASINVSDQYSNIDQVLYEIDGDNNWQQMVNASADNYIGIIQLIHGNHSIKFRAIDAANNSAEVSSIDFEIDTIAPIITVNSPSNGLITNQSVTLDFSVTDDHAYQSLSELNGNPVISGEVITIEGSHELIVTATDEAINQSQQTVNFVIDKTNPIITLTNVTDNQQFAVNNISITGLTEVHSSVSLMNSSNQYSTLSNASGEFTFKNVNLNVGINNLSFTATDQANNQSSKLNIAVYFNSTDACSIFGLKSITPFNLMAFENYQARSSLVQGRLAVANNIDLNNYHIGDQLQVNTAGNVLIAGGNIDFSDGQVFFGNILAGGEINLSQDVIDNMHENAQIIENALIPINFQQSYNEAKLFSNALAELPTNSSHINKNGNIHLTGDCQSAMQTYALSSEELSAAQSLSYECLSDNGYIVLNVTGENIDLSNLNLSQLNPIKQRLIWNFNQANQLIAHHVDVPGSILATQAHLDNDIIFQSGLENNSNNDVYGSFNGHVITHSFNSKARVNLVPLTCNSEIQLNAKPVSINQQLQTTQNTAINFSLETIDENPESLQYQILSPLNSGQLLGTMPNLTYVPESGFVGIDSFNYQVTDQLGQSSQATVTIEITKEILFKNGFETINKAISLVNTMSITGLLTQLILWRRK